MLLLYAYCVCIVSSRKIEHACNEDLSFRVLTGNQQPEHRRISDFLRRNLDALKGLFVQLLPLYEISGMVSLVHVAHDGTKVQANASKHKTISHERMLMAEKELEQASFLIERYCGLKAAVVHRLYHFTFRATGADNLAVATAARPVQSGASPAQSSGQGRPVG